MKLSQFSKREPSKVMPDISWMFGVWSTHSNASSPILQVLKIAFQRLAHTISNNTTISEIGLNYSSVYVQTNKKRYPPKNGPEKTCRKNPVGKNMTGNLGRNQAQALQPILLGDKTKIKNIVSGVGLEWLRTCNPKLKYSHAITMMKLHYMT